MLADLETLNTHHSIPSHISFYAGPGDLTCAVINNCHGTALITLAGAHVMSYRPHGGREVLWTSPKAASELSEAMRGGVPVCWPWFAFHPQDPDKLPLHGLVRTQEFTVVETRAFPSGESFLRLRVEDTPETQALFPHSYQLDVCITLGKSLTIEWTARNPGSTPYTYTGALHPYFLVGSAYEVTLRGLENTDYLDNYDDLKPKHQVDPVTFTTSIDNIYLNTTAEMAIEDPGFRRTTHLRKSGSDTSVVWNPGQDDASMPDVGDGQHVFFVCVESANAANDVITVRPGHETDLGLEIEVEKWRES